MGEFVTSQGLLFAEHRVWTTIAADHEDEDGRTIIDADKIGEREEEWRGYFSTEVDAEALRGSVVDDWTETSVYPCASLRFGNCYVLRLWRPTSAWFKAIEWDSRDAQPRWREATFA